MTKKKDTRGPRERAYDEHMAPLIDKLIALSREHSIPLIVDAELDARDGDDRRYCTTIVGEHKARSRKDAALCLQPGRATSLGVVIRMDPTR